MSESVKTKSALKLALSKVPRVKESISLLRLKLAAYQNAVGNSTLRDKDLQACRFYSVRFLRSWLSSMLILA